MFYLLITGTLLILCILFAIKYKIIKNKFKDNGDLWLGLCIASGVIQVFFQTTLVYVILSINRYNKLITEITYMKPISINVAKYNNAKRELSKTEALINKVADKYQVQVKIENLNGISIYTAPLSQNVTSFNGLGDIERGNGEKLKNLETLIDKQNILAHELLEMANSQYGEEYYTKLQQLNALRYDLFCGVLVRWFGINPQTDLVLIKNKEVYPVGSVLNAK